MRIEISGKHIEMGEALQKHVQESLTASVHKHFEQAIVGKVIFSKHGPMFSCEIIVNDGVIGSEPITAKDQSDDIYTAYNLTLAHAEKQLRRIKRKLKSRSDRVSLSELSLKASNG